MGKARAKAQRQESPLQRANRASHNLTDGWEGRGESSGNNVRALSLRETTGRAETWEWHYLEQSRNWIRHRQPALLGALAVLTVWSVDANSVPSNRLRSSWLYHHSYTRSILQELTQILLKTELTACIIQLSAAPPFTGAVGLDWTLQQIWNSYYSSSSTTSQLAIFLSLLALAKDEPEETALPNPGSLLQYLERKPLQQLWSRRRAQLLAKARSEGCGSLIFPCSP